MDGSFPFPSDGGPRGAARARFERARRVLLAEWRDLIRAGASHQEVEAEISGTEAAMRQIAALVEGRDAG